MQPRIKRAACIGQPNTCGNTASLFANYFWLDQYEPAYRESWICILAFQVLGMTAILTLRCALKRQNNRFAKLESRNLGVDGVEAEGRVLSADEKRAVES